LKNPYGVELVGSIITVLLRRKYYIYTRYNWIIIYFCAMVFPSNISEREHDREEKP
jgi:hypothetical protein